MSEYVDGPTLADHIRNRGPIPLADLKGLATALATGLAGVHAAGVVHGDLQPDNVVLSSNGPRIVGVGVPRPRRDATVVTPTFIAPEQVLGEAATPATDVYAWGGIVLYSGTGRMPFGDGSTPAILYRVMNTEPDFTGLDPNLRPIVERAMAKDPAQRPTAQELFLHLIGNIPAATPELPATSVLPGAAAAAASPGAPSPWAPKQVTPTGGHQPYPTPAPHSQAPQSYTPPPGSYAPSQGTGGYGNQPGWGTGQPPAGHYTPPGQQY
nr:serine/threonine-protein kinase [Micromonospora sp. DSM 115978]